MNAKDLRTDSALGARINNDGSTKYAQSQSGNALQNNAIKTCPDIGTNSLVKVDVQTSRPCAIIGPDRVLPSPTLNDGFIKKMSAEWPCSDNIYRQPPEYSQKMPEYQPTRNISPRQTFQENMQRIMVSPYSSLKMNDDTNFAPDRSVTMLKKKNIPLDGKFCEVPYTINHPCNEQKGARIVDMPVSNTNSGMTRSVPHGWPTTNVNIRPLRPYGVSDLYQYSNYPSCAGPRSMPMPIIRPHQTVHEESGRMYPERYYQDANVRFRPYPPSKERYPHGRYDYINNYSNTLHPPPPFPPHTFDSQKSIPTHTYPLYPQVPLKYIDRRISEPTMDGYQRTNTQAPNLNITYQSPIIHPSYGTLPGNCIQNNMFSYPSDTSPKSGASNKLPYTVDYETPQNKNDISRTHPMKSEVVYSNYTPHNMHTLPQHSFYRKENLPSKNFEYISHFRNLDQSGNFHNPLLRHSVHFSPNAVAISPSDSNTSNDTQTHSTTQEDCGYVSQSSTTSVRSVDSHTSGIPIEHQIYQSTDYRYGFIPRNLQMQIPKNSKSSKTKKDLDVRQFLQMWNEGDDETNEQNKDENIPKDSNNLNNIPSQYETANKQEQLYVLGLMNVPSEELGKYDHIQKISKLPENIKGYNNIELLNQFEEVIESSNIRNFNLKSQREYHTPIKSIMPKQMVNAESRPISPLDVEAKISQSVIHKEVGCNFEIKPCSPKMLNVEIATPIQSLLDERLIEKVSNPIVTKPALLQKANAVESRNFPNSPNFENPSKEVTNVPSCTMENVKYANDNSTVAIKENYSLQDLEYNSSVCLASLPRLDNDIELNFPEINQQFMNANKIESAITLPSAKDLPMLDSDQVDSNLYKEKIGQEGQISSKTESDKEITKLSKYRKLKKTDLEQKENQNQTNTFVKMQFRTDSVIIKNPDKKKDQDGTSSVGDDNNKDKNDLCEQTPQVNNNEKQNSNIPEDTAIDFSLHKNDTDLVKECHIKQNNVSESLVNIIDEDLNIPEAYETSEFQIIQNYNKSNDIDENVKPSNDSDSYTSAQLLNELSKKTSKTSFENGDSVSTATKTIREGFCDVISSEHKLRHNTGSNIINTCNSMCNGTQTNDKEYHLLSNMTCNIEEASQHSLSTISSESSHIDKVLEMNTNTIVCEGGHTGHLTNELKVKVFDQKEYNELFHKEINKNITTSSEDTQSMSEINCMNNECNQNYNLQVQNIQSKSEHTSKTNLKSLDVENITGKGISDNKNNTAGTTKIPFYFKKRLYCALVQNLILFNEGIISKENVTNQCKNLRINSTITLSLQEGNMTNLNLEKLSPQTENIRLESHTNMDMVNIDTKIAINGNVSDNVSDVDVNTNLINDPFNCKNKESCKEISHENPQNIGISPNNNVSYEDEEVDSIQSELKHDNCNLKNSADINIVCNTILINNQTCDDTTLLSSEKSCNEIQKKWSDKLEKQFLNEPKQEFTNNRILLKRSLSDSALNIFSSDDQQNENTDNIYVIPKKRKKINPCELMEPNLIAANLCNIIQTNRRNSISTIYNEKNVSFCILIDNSYVLTGESEESQKICLAEISKDACDGELKDNCTFTSEGVIFADELSVREDFNTNTKINLQNEALSNGFSPHCTGDEHTEEKIFGDTWIEDVACIETVFSDDIAEDIVLDAPLSPNDNNLFECEDVKNESLLYGDNNHLDKIKHIYGNEMCNDDVELVETLYRTPQMDVNKTLVRRESQYLDESCRYYDNDSLEKILSESNDKGQLISGAECSRLKADILCSVTKTQDDKENLEFELPPRSDESYKNTLTDSDNDDKAHKAPGNNVHEPTQYDIVHSCGSSCGNNTISYQQKIESPRYSNSSCSPEVSSTTSEEKSCGILLKITNCNGSISSQINEFNTKNKKKISGKLSENKDLENYTSNISRKRPLITKAAQKYIPPLKETIRDLKVKLPLPQHSLNKLKILKITKDKPKLDKYHNNNHNLFKPHFPKKNKPKFEDVLKSIDEIQIKMHREKNKKQKQFIPKVVIKKNENGAHYASTSNDDTFNPDLTGRKWQPWVFIEKNYFIDKMALNKKVKAVFSHRKKTFVLAEKFRKYKSISDAKFVISQPKTEDISSGNLKYTIRLKQNY